ncbi:hypothetical protein D3C87_1290150 [compost metagenome]
MPSNSAPYESKFAHFPHLGPCEPLKRQSSGDWLADLCPTVKAFQSIHSYQFDHLLFPDPPIDHESPESQDLVWL